MGCFYLDYPALWNKWSYLKNCSLILASRNLVSGGSCIHGGTPVVSLGAYRILSEFLVYRHWTWVSCLRFKMLKNIWISDKANILPYTGELIVHRYQTSANAANLSEWGNFSANIAYFKKSQQGDANKPTFKLSLALKQMSSKGGRCEGTSDRILDT